MSTPPSSIIRADSMSPSRAANDSAVNPPRAIGEIDEAALSRGTLVSRSNDRTFQSAPRSSSSFTTSEWRSAAAHISAVCPLYCSRAFTSAPRPSSIRTTSTLPVRAAVISTVSPSAVVSDFGSAPAFNSASTILALPAGTASERGVAPYRFRAIAPAPARSSRVTASSLFQTTAQWRAVVPSGCATFTSTLRCTSARSAPMSCFWAAAATSAAASAP